MWQFCCCNYHHICHHTEYNILQSRSKWSLKILNIMIILSSSSVTPTSIPSIHIYHRVTLDSDLPKYPPSSCNPSIQDVFLQGQDLPQCFLGFQQDGKNSCLGGTHKLVQPSLIPYPWSVTWYHLFSPPPVWLNNPRAQNALLTDTFTTLDFLHWFGSHIQWKIPLDNISIQCFTM